MSTESLRPSIAETSYRIFDRPLHPELFDPIVVGRIKSDIYDLSIGICEGGHFLQFRSGNDSICEVTAPDQQQLSTFGLQQTYFFNDKDEIAYSSEVPFNYHFVGEVDCVDWGVFTRVNMELEMEAPKTFLSHRFPPQNRLLPGAQSLVRVEGSPRMISVHTFHTFPEDLAVLRTQSLIEIC